MFQVYKFIFILLPFVLIGEALGRENMFRLGYQNCVACHVSPRGGQFLTEYGKLISNSLAIHKGEIKKDKPIYNQMLKARLAHVRTEFSNDTFPMQADYLSAFNMPNGKIISSLARSPQRNTEEDINTLETLYFRVFKYQFIVDQYILTVGREPQNLGFFIEDHTSYIKSENRFNITDLMTVASVDILKHKFNLNIAAFAPSFQEKKENEEYGVKFEADYAFKKVQVGIGGIKSKGETIDRDVLLVNTKVAPFKSVIFLAELQYTHRKIDEVNEFDQVATIASLSYFPIESVEFNTRFESLKKTGLFAIRSDRIGAGMDIKLARHLSLRNDWRRSKAQGNEEDLYISQLYLNWW